MYLFSTPLDQRSMSILKPVARIGFTLEKRENVTSQDLKQKLIMLSIY